VCVCVCVCVCVHARVCMCKHRALLCACMSKSSSSGWEEQGYGCQVLNGCQIFGCARHFHKTHSHVLRQSEHTPCLTFLVSIEGCAWKSCLAGDCSEQLACFWIELAAYSSGEHRVVVFSDMWYDDPCFPWRNCSLMHELLLKHWVKE